MGVSEAGKREVEREREREGEGEGGGKREVEREREREGEGEGGGGEEGEATRITQEETSSARLPTSSEKPPFFSAQENIFTATYLPCHVALRTSPYVPRSRN